MGVESSGEGMGSSASLARNASHMDGAESSDSSGFMKSGSKAVCLMVVRARRIANR